MANRIGGGFAFGQTELTIELASGGIFVPPPGNYLVSLGAVTSIQEFSPTLQEWRNFSPTYDVVSQEMDGANWRLINLSGVCVDLNITNAGSGATSNGIGT